MAQKVPIVLAQSAADLIAGFGAGAKVYVHSSATESGSYSLVSSTALVSGQQGYEIWDPSGSASTWYKSQVGDADGQDFDTFSDPVQVGAVESIVTITGFKLAYGYENETEDATLQSFIDGVNAELVHVLGYFPGPSQDTTRTYDGYAATYGGRRLWIPGGIRAFTTLEVAPTTGATLETVTSGDVVVGPQAWERRPGQPGHYLHFLDIVTGSWSRFPSGIRNVTVTGTAGETFGAEAVDAGCVSRGYTMVGRMMDDWRQGGGWSGRGAPTPSKYLYADDRAYLLSLRAEHISAVA